MGKLIAGRYELKEPVGAGGMGQVWRAYDHTLKRLVAMKRAHIVDERSGDRMRREAETAAGFRHPNVVKVFDAAPEGDELWLVMEYLPWRNLAQLVEQDGPLSPEQTAELGAQLADALAAIHRTGYVHRDVKPGNVLVSEDGRTAVLTDFGISGPVDEEGTGPGRSPRTPRYGAPEAAQGRAVPASDLYSLGATLYTAVTGDLPPVPDARVSGGGALGAVLTRLLRSGPADRPDAARTRRTLSEIAHRRVNRWAVLVSGTAMALALFLAVPMVRGDAGTVPLGSADRSLIGDVHTADPCALMDSSVLERFGDANTEPDYGNFNRCDVIVHISADIKVDVEVELDHEGSNGPPPGKRVESNGFQVVSQGVRDDECNQTILLPDRDEVDVTAKLSSPTGRPDYCALAQAATDHATAVLRNGPVAQHAKPVQGSLIWLNACGLLDPRALPAGSGIDVGQPERVGYGRWDCRWASGAPSSDLTIHLYFDHNDGPLTAKDGQLTRLNGRQAAVGAVDDEPDTCMAEVVQRMYTGYDQRPTAEMMDLKVYDDHQPMSQLCALTTNLAAAAAARFPPPR